MNDLLEVLHVVSAYLVIVLFVFRGYQAWSSKGQGKQSFVSSTYIAYLIVTVSGIGLWAMLDSSNWQWIAAKSVLLLAAISASIKAYRKAASRVHKQQGIFVAGIALAGVLLLSYWQPANFV